MARTTIYRGVVDAFDPNVGLGQIRSESGDVIRFHSTALSDGSRMTHAGVPVVFTVIRGRDGVVEAHGVTQPVD